MDVSERVSEGPPVVLIGGFLCAFRIQNWMFDVECSKFESRNANIEHSTSNIEL